MNATKRRKLNPLRADPTQTATLRRQFSHAVLRRFKRLAAAVYQHVAVEDSFGLLRKNQLTFNSGLVQNTRYQFLTSDQQLKAFLTWFMDQAQQDTASEHDAYWEKYIQDGFKKGALRSYNDVRKRDKTLKDQKMPGFVEGSRLEFLRSSFAQPETVAKVKLLAGRVFTELKGVNQSMATQMSRILSDGLVQGKNPRVIGREMASEIDGISRYRGVMIARTELIRAHAEGQLDALEQLGATQVGVQVEWATAGDDLVCPECEEMEGQIFDIDDAHGLIPLHPNCRCAFIPANVGEEQK
jgi:SPP1 gp7 family putative phage head morphogenesis protein